MQTTEEKERKERKKERRKAPYTRHRVMKFMAIFLNLRPKYITACML